MDANTTFTHQEHTRIDQDGLALEEYIDCYLPQMDLLELTESIAKFSTAELVDAFSAVVQKRTPENALRFFDAVQSAACGYLKLEHEESPRDSV